MRHFLAYHNAEKMGYSGAAIPKPQVKTKNPVFGLNGVTVWLIAGEGKSPKSYYLAANFVASHCELNKYPDTELPNHISGTGALYGITIPISTSLLNLIRTESINFRKGFHEIHNLSIIAKLQSLV